MHPLSRTRAVGTDDWLRIQRRLLCCITLPPTRSHTGAGSSE
jgi:hypothetical protein